MARAAIYARISRDDQGKREGVEDQAADCLQLCERNGWSVVPDGKSDTFTDNDLSGAKDETERPAFGRLVKAIKAGKVDVVVATKQSRLARDADVLIDFHSVCKSANVQALRFVSGADFVFGESRTASLVQAAIDEDYRQQIIESTKRAKKRKADAGERLGGRRLYGYTTGSVPTIVEDEAENIRYAAQAVLDGRTLSSIVREWNDKGLTTSTGSAWRQATLSQMLRNRAYIARTTLRNKDAGPGNWEPILDEDTFRDVGVFLSNPERAPQKIGRVYPLVGVLRCHCGKRLGSTPTRKGDQKIRRYGCRSGLHGNNINADIAEGWIERNVLPLADMPRVGEIIRDAIGREDEEAAALRVSIAQAKTKKAELAQAVSEGVFSLDDIRKPSAQLQADIAANEAQLATLAGRSVLDKFAGRVVKHWSTLDVENQRAILLSLLDCVKVMPNCAGTTGANRLVPVWKFAALGAIDWSQVEFTDADLAQQQAEGTGIVVEVAS